MTAQDATLLAIYNSEEARGLLHTEEYQRSMANLQRVWDTEQNALRGENWTEYHPRSPFLSVEDL